MLIVPTTRDLDDVEVSFAVPLTEEQTSRLKKGSKKVSDQLMHNIIASGEFKGEKNQLVVVHTHGKIKPRHLFLLGLGKQHDVTLESIRRAIAVVVHKAKAMKVEKIGIVSKFEKQKEADVLRAVVESVILSNYAFTKYKTKDKDKLTEITHVELLVDKTDYVNDVVAETQIICEATNYVRDMQNENADVMTPLMIEKQARELAKKYQLKITVFDEKDLKKMGMNLVLAVGKGSSYPARFIILEHKGSSKDALAVLGKGITFDSGGLNLKPTKYIENMRLDMSGAAVVLGVMKAVGGLKMRKHVIGVIPTVENAIGSKSYKPGDVYTAYNGTTVEIGNTDAEGRLILADALAYTEKKLKPGKIVDFATLTGAIVVALGDHVAGMMGTDKEMSKHLFDAGERTAERVWEFPLYEDYSDMLKSDFADVVNISPGYYAGSITAAAFLKKFVEKTPWTHLDIAGTGWLEKSARHYIPKNGTGFGVRLIIDYLKHHG
jgi:leucyl aminopeptidase